MLSYTTILAPLQLILDGLRVLLHSRSSRSGFHMNRKQSLLKILGELNLVYNDLNRLITEYEIMVSWLGNKVQEIKISDSWKMVTDGKYLFIGQFGLNCISRYTIDTLKFIDKFTLTNYVAALDISGNELFVYDWNSLKVLNINTKEVIRSWSTVTETYAIKIYDENLYFVGSDGTIYVYDLFGKLIQQFGKSGYGNGEFSNPCGIDIDEGFIYIADCGNSRIQRFHLKNYTYDLQFGTHGNDNGQFISPDEVRLHQTLCYVGDLFGIQIFTNDGYFLYRFGQTNIGRGDNEFNQVRGILIIDNRLYVSEDRNNRLVVLQ